MNIVLLLGSRNPQGQTARAAQSVRDGAESAGASCESVLLPVLRIERCRQCDDAGWGTCRQEGRCVIGDDFAEIVGKIGRADVVVFATPVYWGDQSESMRAFTDRLRRICTHDTGRASVKGKKAAGLCVAGGGGGGAPSCCTSLDKVLSTCGFEMVSSIPVRRQNLAAKLAELRITGEWLGRLRQEG